MKKILFGILFFIMQGFITVGAVNINDLQDTSRYIKQGDSITLDVYIDRNSVVVVRYAPPYYVIQGKIIYVDYPANELWESIEKYYYDYSSKDMKMQNIQLTTYTFNGEQIDLDNFQSNLYYRTPSSVSWGSNGFSCGNILFYLCYNMLFDDNKPTI